MNIKVDAFTVSEKSSNTNCKVKIILYADPDCGFKGRGPGASLADGRMLVGQFFELLGGGRGPIPVVSQGIIIKYLSGEGGEGGRIDVYTKKHRRTTRAAWDRMLYQDPCIWWFKL